MKKIIFTTILLFFCISLFSQKQRIKKEKINIELDYAKPIHCLGIYLNNGFSYSPQSKELLQGTIIPKIYHSYTPELTLLYSCIIKDGFGLTLEIPFGVFQKTSIFPVSNFSDFEDVRIDIGSYYIGFAAKFSYFKKLNKTIFMQADFGVKFLPFYYSADHWSAENHIIYPNYSMVFSNVIQKNYAVPDFNSSLTFFFHGKNSKKNFSLGLNLNISFVKRIIMVYDTDYSELSDEIWSWGEYSYNTNAIGISFGYRGFGIK